jgi:hypothetical protein
VPMPAADTTHSRYRRPALSAANSRASISGSVRSPWHGLRCDH